MMKKIKIYYVPSQKITREYLLIQQGLLSNSRIKLVDSKEESDFIFLFYTTLMRDLYSAKKFAPNKTVFIDYHDHPRLTFGVTCLAYFKRSWVVKFGHVTKKSIPRPSHYHPISFAIMDEFIIGKKLERNVALSCTIRPRAQHPGRVKILEFVKKLKIHGNKQIGELNQGTMFRFNAPDMREYFELLKRSRIVLTCNPSKWEGDHRMWEAFANGALVFVDKMFTPMINPLIDGEHCIFYEISEPGLNDLRKRLLYFLEHPKTAALIADNGHKFAMKHHRVSNRIDEILGVIT